MTTPLKKHTYTWSGISPTGKKLTGEMQAVSLNQARAHLKHLGITLTTIAIKHKKLFKTFTKKITAIDIALFFRQLATLISASIPIVQSFEILRQSQENPSLSTLIQSLKKEVEAGKNLVIALRKFPNYFDDLTCYLIQIGEQTGTLEIMLKRIAYHKEKSITLRNQIKQALFYPSMIFSVAILVSLVMLLFIVPRFAELFQTMHGQLPLFTQCIVNLSTGLRNYYWLVLIPILLFIITAPKIWRHPEFKQRFDTIILRVSIVNKIILTRFLRSLSITFAAGVPIAEALKILAPTTGNQKFTKIISELYQGVFKGQQLHQAMRPQSLFPLMTIQMIKVGEESGTLEHMLTKIAEIYESDIDHLIEQFKQLLEPLIMIILGALIGGLVIAMYLPIFKLGTVI
jgi:type IV pilus assembly protein PilC